MDLSRLIEMLARLFLRRAIARGVGALSRPAPTSARRRGAPPPSDRGAAGPPGSATGNGSGGGSGGGSPAGAGTEPGGRQPPPLDGREMARRAARAIRLARRFGR